MARRSQRRTVDSARPMRAAMRRNPRPFALCANAVPITSVVSARRGCSAVGSRMWVAAQSAHRTAGAHGRRRRTERADGAFAPVPPFGQRTAAARAAHDGVGHVVGIITATDITRLIDVRGLDLPRPAAGHPH